MPQLTNTQRQKAIREYNMGIPITRIALNLDTSRDTIYRLLRKENIK